jgi:hypothetical protein
MEISAAEFCELYVPTLEEFDMKCDGTQEALYGGPVNNRTIYCGICRRDTTSDGTQPADA